MHHLRGTVDTASSVLLVTLLCTLLPAPALAVRADQELTARVSRAEVLPGKKFTFSGRLTPVRTGVTITRQVLRRGAWTTTGSARTNSKGEWSMLVTAPPATQRVSLRAVARVSGATVLSPVVRIAVVKTLTPKPTPTPVPSDTATVTPPDTSTETATVELDRKGPGNRILGADISRWQHPTSLLFPDGAPIDFTQMYARGVRFVIIKASDGRDTGHNNAAKWYANDRADAQAAGLFTGFYHYAFFPASTDTATIVADATAQADKAVWRLASVGGYTNMDLPFALDLEEWCVLRDAADKCVQGVKRRDATLWTRTWLQRVESLTGRKPIVYSYPSFLDSYITRTDKTIRSYPLWLAHPLPNPGLPTTIPGLATDGTCYITPWTMTPCVAQWTIWQYTSSGKADSYGIAGGNLDLNVFAGTTTDFLTLAKGEWRPTPGDYLPFNETTTSTVSNLVFSSNDRPLSFTVSVNRIIGSPVVSGTVAFSLLADALGVAPTAQQISAIRQTVKRLGTGTWSVSVTGLPAGTWSAQVAFRDTSGVHAPSSAPLAFTLTGAPTDTATATTDTPTATV